MPLLQNGEFPWIFQASLITRGLDYMDHRAPRFSCGTKNLRIVAFFRNEISGGLTILDGLSKKLHLKAENKLGGCLMFFGSFGWFWTEFGMAQAASLETDTVPQWVAFQMFGWCPRVVCASGYVFWCLPWLQCRCLRDSAQLSSSIHQDDYNRLLINIYIYISINLYIYIDDILIYCTYMKNSEDVHIKCPAFNIFI